MIALLDLDGVLADFLGGCLQQHGWNDLDQAKVQWEFWQGKGMSDADFWERLFSFGIFSGRNSKCLSRRPSVDNSHVRSILMQSQLTTPVSQWLCSSLVGYFYSNTAVVQVLGESNPAAIAWLIITIIVNAVELQRWFISVFDCPFSKRSETFPLRANANSTFVIIRIMAASCPHVGPSSVEFGFAQSMRNCIFRGLFCRMTTTGNNTAVKDAIDFTFSMGAALTSVLKVDSSMGFTVSSINYFFDRSDTKSSEFMTNMYSVPFNR